VVVVPIARGVALFLGAFTLLNRYGARRTPGFDANAWWIAIGFLPAAVSGILLAFAAILLVTWTFRPRCGRWRLRTTLAALGLLLVAALDNCVDFYRVWDGGEIDPWLPLPLSLVVVLVLGWLMVVVARSSAVPGMTAAPAKTATSSSGGSRGARAAVAAAAFVACAIVFPLLQFGFFGKTDYRRPADAAVVLGAQVHGDGRPSTSLNDRVMTAVDLYREGMVGTLVMSGGVGESGYNEAEVMRDMAVAEGVPAAAIIVDGQGVTTQATVDGTMTIFGRQGFDRVIAVSHFYHLPRIKLTYARAGRDVLTVPARKTGEVAQTPRIAAREIAGFWVYYLRAVLR
jgi:vancomycin permeability regulator SanA